MNFKQYKPYPTVKLADRTWPSKTIEKAPIWCSVDLRDGNQALPIPMGIEKKLKMYDLLVKMGYKEIEVGFPSASKTEYAFLRELIESNRIPDDVAIQVLTPAREELIEKTFEALEGCKKAIVHLYNSTSTLQRKVVFQKSRKEIIDIALKGAYKIKELAEKSSIPDLIFEYSPESFTGTELEFALEICEEVLKVWQPIAKHKTIINLPATVEMATPNIYADQIEWFCRNLSNRENVIISLHAHNDRGTSIAATELALLAGADRVEGTLFGNGERTGNVDLLTLAMNLYSQGIDPKVHVDDIQEIIDVYEECTEMKVHERHPYAGELVYTAFSGSHQDAIKKGLDVYKDEKPEYWEVPYLPIDPADIGRKYEAIIRINSQSGKGGVAYILDAEFGFKLPKEMHPEFGMIIKEKTDVTGRELSPQEIYTIFEEEYLKADKPCELVSFENKLESHNSASNETEVKVTAKLRYQGEIKSISGVGNGPIDAFFHALSHLDFPTYELVSYAEHALTIGSDSEAVAYIGLKNAKGHVFYGVGRDYNINIASMKAILNGMNREIRGII